MVSQNSEFSLSSIWWLSVETDTTALSYWLNWRVLACAIWVLLGMALSALLIWRYEGHRKNQQSRNKNEGPGFVYKDEIWGTCSRWVHPIWLLGYRVVCFCVMLALVLADIIASGGWKFNFYTQWTFALVTIYFGLGSSLSIYGCLHYRLEVKLEKDQIHDSDADHDSYLPATPGQYAEIRSLTESLNHLDESNCRILASGWGYALQIVFQMCAGAVVLTDLVYWLIIYPFLTPRSKNVTILVVCMHSVNAVLLLGDAILNRLRYPFFRVAYFILWTSVFVIIEWIIHACVSVSWPYAFMDLSSPYAPVWYVAIGLLLFPCFGIFSLVFLLKNQCSSR
ncbi:uncharacterized protein LOC127241346 isoform X2 [Andrographis paniculata]|uniref:uncharacterized protein LOC127241346 isoform X2 n=1 Tax=Andrographis paniculata TaxID=175694 RepID=UPI0021E986D8|nr:uncharacterized protein LOC127241346 isoform X2 [Andrographis paniculata]